MLDFNRRFHLTIVEACEKPSQAWGWQLKVTVVENFRGGPVAWIVANRMEKQRFVR